MACFLAPAVEAIAVSVVKHHIKKKENKIQVNSNENSVVRNNDANKIPFSKKLSWLNSLLWGGSFLLLIEHIWHGEVVPWFPFLSAMGNPEDTITMLQEIATAGVGMAVLCTAVWGIMLAVLHILENKKSSRLVKKLCA
ncbi:MAG: hypothetical protein ACI4HN_10665 [Ruminococcus sp.]